jgi:hypothetical protein
MGNKRFFRELFRNDVGTTSRHVGNDLADEVRDAMGPQAGGAGSAGRVTGGAAYRHIEDRQRNPDHHEG